MAVLMTAYRETKKEAKLLGVQDPQKAMEFLESDDCRFWCDVVEIDHSNVLDTLERIENDYVKLQLAQDNRPVEV